MCVCVTEGGVRQAETVTVCECAFVVEKGKKRNL